MNDVFLNHEKQWLEIIAGLNATILVLSDRNSFLEARYAEDHDPRHPFNRRSGDQKDARPSGHMSNGDVIP